MWTRPTLIWCELKNRRACEPLDRERKWEWENSDLNEVYWISNAWQDFVTDFFDLRSFGPTNLHNPGFDRTEFLLPNSTLSNPVVRDTRILSCGYGLVHERYRFGRSYISYPVILTTVHDGKLSWGRPFQTISKGVLEINGLVIF